MCGAFSILHPFKEIERGFNAGYSGAIFPRPKYNVRPGQDLPVISNDKPEKIKMAKWGINPVWDEKKLIFNTRKESLTTKKMYQESFYNRRCLIPADGFYEWLKMENHKLPFRFELKDKGLFAFAGIWEKDGESDQIKFSIITTEPNSLVYKVHDRMPVMLLPKQKDEWLDKNKNTTELMKMLLPFESKLMVSFPVSTLVNSAKNDSPDIIKPI